MDNIRKTVIFTLIFFIFFLINKPVLASDSSKANSNIVFKAEVLEIIDEEEKKGDDGRIIKQQNVRLLGVEGDFKNKEIIFIGIGNVEVLGNKVYKEGQRVFVLASWNQSDNSYNYYITDYSRKNILIIIGSLFFLLLLLVGKFKGLRSVASLFLTFLIIIFFIVPKILNGANPVLITSVGSFLILLFIVYLTEGFNAKSHISALSIFLSLSLVIGFSWLFINLAKLSGAFNEDVFILLNIGQSVINFKGFLLAGIIIGTLGVIDDIIISQVAAVEQIVESNPHQDWKDVFNKAHKIGVSHISSMTNTLFLAYAGVSLPVLILFVSPENPFASFEQMISSEAISTEIVRALSGSIGIILSVPLSTFFASWWFIYKTKKDKFS